MFRTLSLAVAAGILSASTAFAAPEIGKPAPDFSAADISGKPVSLAAFKGRLVVLEWNNPECPFVKKHYDSGNMQKLQSEAVAKEVVWLTVNSSAAGKQGNLTAATAGEYVQKQKASPAHYILDPEGKIGTLYEAKTTPHMFVIDKTGTLAYMGAIDDKPSTQAADIPDATNYVLAALDSLAAGKPVTVTATQAYGCNIKY